VRGSGWDRGKGHVHGFSLAHLITRGARGRRSAPGAARRVAWRVERGLTWSTPIPMNFAPDFPCTFQNL
jgi:hypothetical protein